MRQHERVGHRSRAIGAVPRGETRAGADEQRRASLHAGAPPGAGDSARADRFAGDIGLHHPVDDHPVAVAEQRFTVTAPSELIEAATR